MKVRWQRARVRGHWSENQGVMWQCRARLRTENQMGQCIFQWSQEDHGCCGVGRPVTDYQSAMIAFGTTRACTAISMLADVENTSTLLPRLWAILSHIVCKSSLLLSHLILAFLCINRWNIAANISKMYTGLSTAEAHFSLNLIVQGSSKLATLCSA